MSSAEVARRLGMAKWQVQVIEFRALNKVRAAFDIPVVPEPSWMKTAWPTGTERRCGKCGEPGHYSVTCGREGRAR